MAKIRVRRPRVRKVKPPAEPTFRERAFEQTVPPDDPALRQNIVEGETPPLDRQPERNVNFNYLETTDDVLRTIDEMSVEQPVIGHGETSARAAGMDETATIDRLMRGKPAAGFDTARMLKARQVMVGSAERISELAQQIATKGADDETLLQFRQMVAQHRAIQATVQGMTAEAGRVLNQFKIPVGGEMRTRAVRDLLAATGGPDVTFDMARDIARLGDPARVSQFVEQSWWAKRKDQLLSIYYNFMLSSPVTHARNIAGNSVVQMFEIPERILAGGISRIPGIGSGQSYATEGLVQARELMTSILEGLRMGSKAFVTGESMDPMRKLDQPAAQRFASDVIGISPDNPMAGAMDMLSRILPTNLLMTEDEFFKGMSFRQHYAAQAARQAKSEGLSGKAFTERYNDLMENPGEFAEQWYNSSIDYARYQTFTNLAEGKFAEGLRAVANAGGDLGRLVVPFTNTPINIVKYVTERSVAAPLMPQRFWAAVRAGGPQRDLALARMLIGWSVTGWVVSKVMDGEITGRGPANPDHREAWRNSGDWREYSIKIGDEWVYYNGLDPIGMMIGTVATVADYVRYSDDEEGSAQLMMGLALATAENMTTKQYMQGVADLIDALEDPYARERYIQREAGVLVPAGVAHIRRLTDETYRETEGGDLWQEIINYAKNRLPVASETLPPRVDIWGEIITNPGAYGPDLFSPLYKVSINGRTGTAELIKNGVTMQRPRCTIAQGGGEVSLHQVPDERGPGWACYEWRRAVGQHRREAVDQLVDRSEYRGLPDGDGPGTKGYALREAMSKGMEAAKRDMVRAYPMLESMLQLDTLITEPPRELPPTLLEF